VSVRIRIRVIAILSVLALAGCARMGTAGGGSVSLDERDNGHTVRVTAGMSIVVVLDSTYWMFDALTGTDVLRPRQAPSAVASRGGGCVPGSGCGSVTATFTAVGAGVANVRATRTSCGEALRCGPEQGSFTVTIVVGGGAASARLLPGRQVAGLDGKDALTDVDAAGGIDAAHPIR
jgi:hypothetical protein